MSEAKVGKRAGREEGQDERCGYGAGSRRVVLVKWLSGSTLARAVKLDRYRRLTTEPAVSLLRAFSSLGRNQWMLLQLLRLGWGDVV